MKTVAKVGRSGRAQIPIGIRDKMGICAGDQIIIDIMEVIKNE